VLQSDSDISDVQSQLLDPGRLKTNYLS